MNKTEYFSRSSLLMRTIAIASLVMLVWSCNDDVDVPDGAFDEKVVNLSGDWGVVSVTQNGINITDRLEFSRLSLTLNMDANGPSSYTIENDGIPFIVTQDGNWQYDDKIYPREIKFNAGGETLTGTFASPPISGGTDFAISFPLGCADNTYVYQFNRQ